MRFKYKAFDLGNNIIKGEIEAHSDKEVLYKIREQGLRPVKITQVSEFNRDIKLFDKPFRAESLYIFLYQLYVLLNSDITVVKSFEILKSMYQGTQRKIIDAIHRDLISANTLSQSLSNAAVFPELLINMVKIGENSSNLPEIFANLSEYYRNRIIFEKKIKNALIYPIILLLVTILVVNFLILHILPTFQSVFEDSGSKLPIITELLLKISKFINKNFITFFGISVFILLALIIYFNSQRGKLYFDKLKLKSNLYKMSLMNNFISMMKLLIKSGATVSESIDIMALSVENKILKKTLEQASKDIYRGFSLSESLKNSKIFSEMDKSMLKIGEESSNLSEILDSLSYYYRYEIEIKQQKFLAVFEPAIILVLSLFVGFIVISVAMPMFDLVNNI
ncbi:putative bacterial type II secretion system protein F [Peptoniphilus sp. ING2-D1G]|nr:putative bacterial type II secretion system protein F [Peptoniphilus sp. ING2-D1G]